MFEEGGRQRFKLDMNIKIFKLDIIIKRELGVEKRKIKYMVDQFIFFNVVFGER